MSSLEFKPLIIEGFKEISTTFNKYRQYRLCEIITKFTLTATDKTTPETIVDVFDHLIVKIIEYSNLEENGARIGITIRGEGLGFKFLCILNICLNLNTQIHSQSIYYQIKNS